MLDRESFAAVTSREGWAKVDYDRRRWIPCLAVMPVGFDTAHWAREFAAGWWSLSGLPHCRNDVARLEAQLACIRDSTYGHLPCHMAFIHLPDPRLNPLPVFLAILQACGEKTAQLRLLARADDPLALRPPIVEDFSTDRLGVGLRVVRQFADSPDLRAVGRDQVPQTCTGLSYAWRSDQYHTDLRLFTDSPDFERLNGAIPDIDELARWISVVPDTAKGKE